MSKSAFGNGGKPGAAPSSSHPALSDESRPSVNPEELLSLLSDEYGREVLKLISETALPAREIADRIDASRATVYRRLDRLKEAGVVETSMTVHSEGHHRQRFHASLDEASLSFEEEGIRVEHAT